jgi:hypothetical protein
MRERLVFRCQRRGGDVRHHETRVDSGIAHQERRQSRQRLVDQQGDTPLRERSYLGDGQSEDIGGERHRLAMEIPSGKHFARIGEHQRIVGHRVRLDDKRRGDMAHEVEASAHDLRLATQAVRILHAIVVDQVRAANLAARQA